MQIAAFSQLLRIVLSYNSDHHLLCSNSLSRIRALEVLRRCAI